MLFSSFMAGDDSVDVKIDKLPLGFTVGPGNGNNGLVVTAVSEFGHGAAAGLHQKGVSEGWELLYIGTSRAADLSFGAAKRVLDNASVPFKITFSKPSEEKDNEAEDKWPTGAKVAIYCAKNQEWFEDGSVTRNDMILAETIDVRYNNGQLSKRVEMEWFDELLRQPRPNSFKRTSVVFNKRPLGFKWDSREGHFHSLQNDDEVACVTEVSEKLARQTGLRVHFTVKKINGHEVNDLPHVVDQDYFGALDKILRTGELPIMVLFEEMEDEEEKAEAPGTRHGDIHPEWQKYVVNDPEGRRDAEEYELQAEQERLEYLAKIFKAIDLDHNGVIDTDEFNQMANTEFGWSDEVAQKTFQEIDTDGNGTLDFDEFCEAIASGTTALGDIASIQSHFNHSMHFNLHGTEEGKKAKHDAYMESADNLLDEDAEYVPDEDGATDMNGFLRMLSSRMNYGQAGDDSMAALVSNMSKQDPFDEMIKNALGNIHAGQDELEDLLAGTFADNDDGFR